MKALRLMISMSTPIHAVPSEQGNLNQCQINAGPPSTMLVRHYPSIWSSPISPQRFFDGWSIERATTEFITENQN